MPRHVPWHQSLGEKRCGSVFASGEKRRGCCLPVEKECVVRETEGEERAAARALSSVVGRWVAKRCGSECSSRESVEGVVCQRRNWALWRETEVEGGTC